MTKRRGWTKTEPVIEPPRIGHLTYPKAPLAEAVGETMGPDINGGIWLATGLDDQRLELALAFPGRRRKDHVYRPSKLWVRAR